MLHLLALRVAVDLLQDEVNLLLLEVDDVVHETLCQTHVLAEALEIERSLRRKRVVNVTIEIDGQKTATVVGTERNFAARIG